MDPVKAQVENFLISLCRGIQPKISWNDVDLQAVYKIYKYKYVDHSGKITPHGALRGLMAAWSMRRIEVLVLAFILSKPKSASLQEFTWLAVEFGINELQVKNAFSNIANKKGFIKRRARTVYSVTSNSKMLIKPYKKLLEEINVHRDELFRGFGS